MFRAFLFDIDGTLIRSAGAGVKALARAVEPNPAMAGALDGLRLDGMTDRAICRTLLAAHHEEVTEAAIDGLIERYLEALEASLPAHEGRVVVHAGVHAALDALGARGAVIGLATGNVERGARLKLSAVNLWHRFDAARSGFGSDHEDRAALVRVGVARCGFAADEVLVIGDTPRDIAAAHAAGAACLAVATGRYSVEDLSRAGADETVRTLEAEAALRLFAR